MGLSLDNLRNCFVGAKNFKAKYIAVKVSVNNATPEIIINNYENFDEKLAYYEKAYNHDLTLKNNTNIKIIGFTFGNTFSEIEEDLFGGKE